MKIGIVGLGLIGGSLAIAAKERLGAEIVALSRSEAPLKKAYDDGIVSEYSVESMEMFSGCDIIFVCTPVDKIAGYCQRLRQYVGKDTIISDAGSTKERICREMEKISDISFIGGHPMAGTQYSGYGAAMGNLFENAVYVITPLENSKKSHIKKLTDFIKAIGAKPVVMEADRHDRTVAAVSHVPHIIAYALANEVAELEDSRKSMQTLAAGGFKDTTRIASSSPEVWSAICRENKDNVINVTKAFMEKMQEALTLLENEQYDGLSQFFKSAKLFRDGFNRDF